VKLTIKNILKKEIKKYERLSDFEYRMSFDK